MMRSTVFGLVLVTSFLSPVVAPVAGQVAGRSPIPQPLWKPDEQAVHMRRARASWHSRLFTALGGAALGAGIGYFSSQVFRGDWDEQPGRSEVNRRAWAMVGGSVGLAVGFSFPVFGRGASPEPSLGLPAGRFQIVAEDFRGKGANNADDVVRALRPEWLIERGVNIFGESPSEALQIYLDEVQLGGVRFLRDVSAQIIRSMHYFDPAAATYRWGAGHSHGVILIIAEGGGPGSPN